MKIITLLSLFVIVSACASHHDKKCEEHCKKKQMCERDARHHEMKSLNADRLR